MSQAAVDKSIMQSISKQQLSREPLDEQDKFTIEEVEDLFRQKTLLYPLLGLKPLYMHDEKSNFEFFADGEILVLPLELKSIAINMIEQDVYQCDESLLSSLSIAHKKEWFKCVNTCLNHGLWLYDASDLNEL